MSWRGRAMRAVRASDNASFATREPVAVAAAAPTLLAAVLAVLSAFGVWSPTDEQLASLWGLWAVLTPILAAWARNRVIPGTLVPEDDGK